MRCFWRPGIHLQHHGHLHHHRRLRSVVICSSIGDGSSNIVCNNVVVCGNFIFNCQIKKETAFSGKRKVETLPTANNDSPALIILSAAACRLQYIAVCVCVAVSTSSPSAPKSLAAAPPFTSLPPTGAAPQSSFSSQENEINGFTVVGL